jgi:hypothetical protein
MPSENLLAFPFLYVFGNNGWNKGVFSFFIPGVGLLFAGNQ